MKYFKFSILTTLSIFLLLNLTACGDKEEIKPGDKGKLSFEFDNVAGANEFALGTTYTNASGEPFTVSLFQYYISNIKLKNAEGKEVVLPQTYHLIKESNSASQKFTLQDIPADDYVEVSFTIGVDSLRNTLDPSQRTGDLDVGGNGADMYWSWNSGYIFMKMEGNSSSIPIDTVNTTQSFYYHIGGFGGYSSPTINNIRQATLSFNGTKATIRTDITPEIHIETDILKIFTGVKNLRLAEAPVIMFSAASLDVSNNYKSMFSVMHVHNEK